MLALSALLTGLALFDLVGALLLLVLLLNLTLHVLGFPLRGSIEFVTNHLESELLTLAVLGCHFEALLDRGCGGIVCSV